MAKHFVDVVEIINVKSDECETLFAKIKFIHLLADRTKQESTVRQPCERVVRFIVVLLKFSKGYALHGLRYHTEDHHTEYAAAEENRGDNEFNKRRCGASWTGMQQKLNNPAQSRA